MHLYAKSMSDMEAAAVVALICFSGVLAAATNVWTGASSGAWGEPSNWNTQSVPAADDIAVFTGPATVAPPADFRGCIRNMGSGELTVSVAADAEFSLALGSYSFAGTGASFRKTGSGKLTLHAWPGVNPGKVTIAEGPVDFVGNGDGAAGAFDEVEIAAGVVARVASSPAATRFGYWYAVSQGSMTGDEITSFRETGDTAEIVARCENNAYVPEGNTSTKGVCAIDRAVRAFDVAGCPTAAFTAVGNKDGVQFYYRGVMLVENPGSYSHAVAITHGNGINARFSIDAQVFKLNTKTSVTLGAVRFEHGWRAFTFGGRGDNRYVGAPAAFTFSRNGVAYPGDTGGFTGVKFWNGVCFNALKVCAGASVTIADGSAMAVANARRLEIEGSFESDTSDAHLYLASDWADASHTRYFALDSLDGFGGTVDLGASAVVLPHSGTPSFSVAGEGRIDCGEDPGTIVIGDGKPLEVPVNTLERGSGVTTYSLSSAQEWTFAGDARYSSFLAPNGVDTITFRSPVPAVEDGVLVMTRDTGSQRSTAYLDGAEIAYGDEFRCRFAWHAYLRDEYRYAGRYGYRTDFPTYTLGIFLKPTSTTDKTGSGYDYISLPPDVSGFCIGGWFTKSNKARGLWDVNGGRIMSGNPAVLEGNLASGDMTRPYDVTLHYKSGILSIRLRQGDDETLRTLDVHDAFAKDGKVHFGFVGRTGWSSRSDGSAYEEASWAWQEISKFNMELAPSSDGLTARNAGLSSERWAIFGAAQWQDGGDSVAVIRADAYGRGGCILKEGIPAYAAFEFSADVYRGAPAGYNDQGDNMFGLFVQSAGPDMDVVGGWNSRFGNVLPKDSLAFGGYVSAYRDARRLYWVTNRVTFANKTDDSQTRTAGTDAQTWSCVKDVPLRYTLAYDGLGTFTFTVQKDAAGNTVSSTWYYPQLGDARYREDGIVKTSLYPSFLGTASNGSAWKAVVVSNAQLKVQSPFSGVCRRVLPQVSAAEDSVADIRIGSASASETPSSSPEVQIGEMALASSATVRISPYWSGESATVAVKTMRVPAAATLEASGGVRLELGALEFSGVRGTSLLRLQGGTVRFASPFVIAIPDAWLPPGPSGISLADVSGCTLEQPFLPGAATVVTASGRDVASAYGLSLAGGLLTIRPTGSCVILR